MGKEIVIDFKADGSVEGMYFDEFPLTFLGKANVERASLIVFNVLSQRWDVVLTGQNDPIDAATCFRSYEGAREFEVLWLQGSRKQGVDPLSPEGTALAETLRGQLI